MLLQNFCDSTLSILPWVKLVVTPLSLIHTNTTELNVPDEVKLEHFEMNTNDAYGTNTAEIATTENVAYMTAEDAIPATQNVAYGEVPPGTDDSYDYII